MLNELLKFASKQESLGKDFGERRIRWLVAFNEQAEYVSLLRLGAEGEGKRYASCPFSGTATQGKASDFLFEKMEVLLKIDDMGELSPKRSDKHQYFVNTLREAGRHSPDLKLLAQALSKDSVIARIRTDFIAKSREGKKKADAKLPIGETFTLAVNNRCVLDSTEWHDWWKQRQAPEQDGGGTSEAAARMRCIATGEVVEPAERHERKIEGLKQYGGRGQDSLIAFDKEAYQSFGLRFAANASMSATTADRYATALNALIRNNSVAIGGVLAVYWFARAIPNKQDDPIALALAASGLDEEAGEGGHAARRLFESVKKGEREEVIHNEYHALLLSGASGRVMVRHYDTGTMEKVAAAVNQWFDDLGICNLSESGGLAKASGLQRLVEALLPPKPKYQKYEDWIRPADYLAPGFWLAALQAHPIPNAVHRLLVQRLTSQWLDLAEAEKKSNQGRADNGLLYASIYRRMGLLKAFHVRNLRDLDMKPHLNPEHPAPAYHCGRMLAVMANLQRAALGDVGAGVVQRYYGAVSQAPALHLGRLVANAKNHLGKLEPGLAFWFEDQISGIASRIGDHAPRTLTLEEQSLFALGYYQQLAQLRERRGDKPAIDAPIESETN
jgi:CRISPR-associated protein Csd1